MKSHILVPFCLMVSFVFAIGFFAIRTEFNGVDGLKAKIASLDERVEHEELRARLSAHQLAEYRQQVATLIPGAANETKDPNASYQLRVLASVVSVPDGDIIGIERAASTFEKAKREFRSQNFETSNAGFKSLIEKYPASIYVPEAYFLLSEGQYQLKEYESCIDTVEAMLNLFPESELTGYSLLRLGKIYEVQDRIEDAIEIYKTVKTSYVDNQLKTQASTSLKAVEL